MDHDRRGAEANVRHADRFHLVCDRTRRHLDHQLRPKAAETRPLEQSMQETFESKASGMQIAFLVFAIVFLAYPIQKYLGPIVGLEVSENRVAGRLLIFVP